MYLTETRLLRCPIWSTYISFGDMHVCSLSDTTFKLRRADGASHPNHHAIAAHPNPPMDKSPMTTRWQGTTGAKGFR